MPDFPKPMNMSKRTEQDLNTFIEEWKDTPEKCKEAFLYFMAYLGQKEGVTIDFISRAGVTHSLRAAHSNQKRRMLFTLIDVIEDAPRWLSICFYSDWIDDTETRGDFIPKGILGEDAVCFDLEEWDQDLIGYIEARVDEACRNASEG